METDFVAVLVESKSNRWGDVLDAGREFPANVSDAGLVRVRYSCDDLIFDTVEDCEMFGLRLYPPLQAPSYIAAQQELAAITAAARLEKIAIQEKIQNYFEGKVVFDFDAGKLTDLEQGGEFYFFYFVDNNGPFVEYRPTPFVSRYLRADASSEVGAYIEKLCASSRESDGLSYSFGSEDGFMSPGYD